MRRSVSCAAVLAGLVVPASAQAGHITFGSNLKADASIAESEPVDSAYWNTALASGARFRAPAKGEISTVKLKGRINKPQPGAARPNVVLHFQVLRPVGGGRMKVMLTTGNLRLPFGGSRNRITTYRLQKMPARICVRKGDYVALSTNGGFGPLYPDGAEFAMFGAVPGSSYAGMTGQGKDMDGDVFRGTERADRELLLRATVATKGDARPFCR